MEAYQLTLLEIFEERRRQNSSYSLRAFARSCGVSPASISQILSSKRRLTLKSAKRIAERLAFAPDQKQKFLALRPPTKNLEEAELGERERLDLDRFRLIADWYHYAILSLGQLQEHKASAAWISNKLGITRAETESALQRLISLKLLTIEKGKLRQSTSPLVSTNDVPSAALRKHHRQCLDRAGKALEEIQVEWREFGVMTMALDPKKLPQAKKMIRQFRQQIAALCESGKPKLVYHFCTQLFPVNHPEKFLDLKEYENES